MGISERRERDVQEMRDNIIKAAFDIILNEGPEQVSIRKIAARIEYSPTSVYNYFRDRDAILLEIARISFRNFDEFIETSTRSINGNMWERLLGAARLYIEFALTQTHYYEVMFLIKFPPQKIEGVYGDPAEFLGRKSYMNLRELISGCINEGFLPAATDPDLCTLAVWGNLHGLVSLHIRDRFIMVPGNSNAEFLSRAFESWIQCINQHS